MHLHLTWLAGSSLSILNWPIDDQAGEMPTVMLDEPWILRKLGHVLLMAFAALAWTAPASADQEASNVAHVAAGPYGRCYAKSVPAHIYDPDGEPRQQGHTTLFRAGDGEDIVERRFDWFSQKLFLKCGAADDSLVVRIGPWHRGHDPRADHLAIAFYRGGTLLKRYSTLDIAGGEKAINGRISKYANVSASVSHYTVFEREPEMVRVITNAGPVLTEDWIIKATTIDGRALMFDMESGQLQ
jgi:hypothetical protein